LNIFDFRPYFQQAIMGKPSTYLGLGTASGRRGAYFSHPIFVSEQKKTNRDCGNQSFYRTN
jgi:C4-dicarboxylate-specific signal transduction histidine kinase